MSSLLGLQGAAICILTSTVLLLLFRITTAFNPTPDQVIYAVNAGGPEYVDSHGIRYQKDPLNAGIISDPGLRFFTVFRVSRTDAFLYRSKHYDFGTFGYEFNHAGDGNYTLILKFCETYFLAPYKKIFDVVLNGKHTIVSQLDIFLEAGMRAAHDEVVNFIIKNGRVQYNGEISDARNGSLRLDFVKRRDRPQINAFVLLKGDDFNVPPLPPARGRTTNTDKKHISTKPPEEKHPNICICNNGDENDEDYLAKKYLRPCTQSEISECSPKKRSAPRQPDPYVIDDSSILLSILVAVATFLPIVLCLSFFLYIDHTFSLFV